MKTYTITEQDLNSNILQNHLVLISADAGGKKSLKGLLRVDYVNDYGQYNPEIKVFTEQTPLQESVGLLQVIYENGAFYNQTSLTKIRENLRIMS